MPVRDLGQQAAAAAWSVRLQGWPAQGLWTCANGAAFRDGDAALAAHGVMLWLLYQRVLGPHHLLVGAGHRRQLALAGAQATGSLFATGEEVRDRAPRIA